MSYRCPKLEMVDCPFFGPTKYKCTLTGLEMYDDDAKVKHVCKAESGYEYEKCPVYQDR